MDELAASHGISQDEYTTVRVGMNVADALKRGQIDAGIGLENVQMVELEEWCKENGRDPSDVKMLRIDELACLGCCCFCSILYIANTPFLESQPDKVRAFLRAIKRATDYVTSFPVQAWEELKLYKKTMNTPVNERIFERSFVYLSRDCANVQRDWNKVTNYCKRLKIVAPDFQPNMTNDFISWNLLPDVEDPIAKQIAIGQHQKNVAAHGGVLSLTGAVSS